MKWWLKDESLDARPPLFKSCEPVRLTFRDSGRQVSLGGRVECGDERILDGIFGDCVRQDNRVLAIAEFVAKLPAKGQEFRSPTLSSIACEGGGCDDKAILALYCLRRMGFPTRFVFEGTFSFLLKSGTAGFQEQFEGRLPFTGRKINSHAYVEVFDPSRKEVMFLDPSAGFVGNREFCERRLLGVKPFLIPSMPFVMFASGQSCLSLDGETENITAFALVDLLDGIYPSLSRNAAAEWQRWREIAMHYQSWLSPWSMTEGEGWTPDDEDRLEAMRKCSAAFRRLVRG